ncbi:MAG: hypothetical protein WDO15_04220 [Bacteroidota bacterium]
MGTGWDTATFYWDNPSFHTYVRVPKSTDINLVQSRLNGLLIEQAKSFPNIVWSAGVLSTGK